MAGLQETHDTVRKGPDRLPTRDRWILAGLTVLAAAAALSAAWYGFWAEATFFGEELTPREGAIAGQARRAVLWALATPWCCWAVLRRGREAPTAAAVWLVLVVALAWWASPPEPEGIYDGAWESLWSSDFGVLPWCLVGASLTVGLVAAFRDKRTAVRAGAVAVAAAIAASAVASYARLEREAPRHSAAGVAE